MTQQTESNSVIEINADTDLSVLFEQASHLMKPASNSGRSIRYYTVEVETKDGTKFTHYHVPGTVAGRKRNKYRSYGWKVSLIEEGTEAASVERTPNLNSGSLHIADPNTKHHYNQQQQEAIKRLREIHLAPLNEKAVKNKRTLITEPIRIYNNNTGRMIFSGTLQGAVEFLQAQIGKTLTQTDWTIYLPEKIYKAITR